jgi:hypothetical protein
MKSTQLLFAALACLFEQASGFAQFSQITKTSLRLQAQTQEHLVRLVDGDDQVLDVASFRNGLVNPEMMVERATAKRDAIDTKKAALDGLKIGLLYIGPVVAIATYLEAQDPVQAITNYGEE